MLADCHCHLDELSNPDEEVQTALKLGVTDIISCSQDLESMQKNLEFCKTFPSVHACFGIHPNNAGLVSDAELEKAVDFVKENIDYCYAVGEIGLDFHHTDSAEKRLQQEKVFNKFIDLALYYDKAIVVHSRGAEERVMQILKERDVGKALLHWFHCDDLLLNEMIVSKFFVSVGPSIFSQKKYQDFCKKAPKNLLLLETDAPVEFNGVPSSPSWIPKVLEKAAELKEMQSEDLRVELERNVQILFL